MSRDIVELRDGGQYEDNKFVLQSSLGYYQKIQILDKYDNKHLHDICQNDFYNYIVSFKNTNFMKISKKKETLETYWTHFRVLL